MFREGLQAQVAASLEASPEMLPYLAELLVDSWELGSDAQAIVSLLQRIELSASYTLLDLGCGKGPVAISCAAEFGCRAHGVDGFEPFIAEAIDRASAHSVSELCTFACADLREVVNTARGYDVVVFSSVSPVIDGRPCVASLRECVRPGGHMVIDDGFLADVSGDVPPGYADYAPYAETRARLTAAGDVIVSEVLPPAGPRSAVDDHTTEMIRRRAAAISRREPQAADLLEAYVRNQEEECERLRRFHVPATWLLRRV